MPIIIKLTGIGRDVWINANKIIYMKEADGETAVFMEGSSVALFVRERVNEIAKSLRLVYQNFIQK